MQRLRKDPSRLRQPCVAFWSVGYAEGFRCLACPAHDEPQGVKVAVLIDVDGS